MAAGEPVTERNDLFGATVQLAARLCSRADSEASSSRAPCMTLRWARASPSAAAASYGSEGFDSAMPAFEVVWRTSGS